MILTILAVVAVLVIGVLLYAATRPDTFRYTRSLAMNAPADTVFGYINDLHRFQEWNPFVQGDPNNHITYSGPESGVGAACDWSGGKSGEGTMTLMESQPDKLVRFRMDFRKPFAASHTAVFTLKSEGLQTVVSWTLYGDNHFFGKLMGVFINGDKMCGREFVKGLTHLRNLVEPASSSLQG